MVLLSQLREGELWQWSHLNLLTQIIANFLHSPSSLTSTPHLLSTQTKKPKKKYPSADGVQKKEKEKKEEEGSIIFPQNKIDKNQMAKIYGK